MKTPSWYPWIFWLVFIPAGPALLQELHCPPPLLPAAMYLLSGLVLWSVYTVEVERRAPFRAKVGRHGKPVCPSCATVARRSAKYDALYCPTHGWLEPTCSDPDCVYCPRRPPRPPEDHDGF